MNNMNNNNNKINFVKLFNKSQQPLISKNVFTLCLFNMQKVAYKKFEQQYYQPLIKMIPILLNKFNDWGIVCYFDIFMLKTNPNLLKDFLDKYSNNNRIQIYLYFMPNFLLADNSGHVGTSGTMVRFIPLFTSEYNMVWCIDADMDNLHFFNLMDKYVLPIFFNNPELKFCVMNNTLNKYLARHPEGIKYLIVANSFISKITFPSHLINNFMADDKIEYNYYYSRYSKKNNNQIERFPYGGDEWFLNKFIYNYLQNNSIPVLVQKNMIIDYLSGLRYCDKKLEIIYRKNKDLYHNYLIPLSKITAYFYWYENDKESWQKYKRLSLKIRDCIFKNYHYDQEKVNNMPIRCKGKMETFYNLDKIYTPDAEQIQLEVFNLD
jgi:hypothetical protein